ncbi:uncharacterized protein LOC135822799 [Sycon ciliatum]|uniref:uncharacterized protein LOC135822799 n=1 Tax=Sycon ciliatum TaxID=27933 RepID=UPI0031F68440
MTVGSRSTTVILLGCLLCMCYVSFVEATTNVPPDASDDELADLLEAASSNSDDGLLNAWKTVTYGERQPTNRQKHTASLVRAPKDNRDFMLVFGGVTYRKATSVILLQRECIHSVGNGTDEAALCCRGTATNEVWAYVIVDKYWLEISREIGPSERFDHSADSLRDKSGILMYGGRTYLYYRNGSLQGSQLFSDVWIFTLSTALSRYDFGKWIQVQVPTSGSASPGARFGSVLGTIDDSTFAVFGGCLSTGFHCDDFRTDLWILKVTPSITASSTLQEQSTFTGVWSRIDTEQSQAPPPSAYYNMQYTGNSRNSFLVLQGLANVTHELSNRSYPFYEFKLDQSTGSSGDVPTQGRWHQLEAYNVTHQKIGLPDTSNHIYFDPMYDCLFNVRIQPTVDVLSSVMSRFCFTSSAPTFPSEGSWQPVLSEPVRTLEKPFPLTLSHQTATFTEDEVLLFGGVVETFTGLESENLWSLGINDSLSNSCDSDDRPTSGVCTLNVSAYITTGWAEVTTARASPEPRAFSASVTIANIVYILGGQPISLQANASTLSVQDNIQRNLIWSYEPTRQLWEPVALDNPDNNEEFNKVVSKTTYVIDLSAVAVHTPSVSPELEERYGSQYIVIFFGGFVRTDSVDCRLGQLLNSVVIISAPHASVWSLRYFHLEATTSEDNSTWPTPRRGHTATLHNATMYIFGGAVDQPMFNVTNELWAYDVVAMTWERIRGDNAASPTARFGHTAQHALGVIYMFGGADASGVIAQDEAFWAFNIASRVWINLSRRIKPGSSTPFQRFFHSSALIGQSKFAIAGGCIERIEHFGTSAGCIFCRSRLVLDDSTWVYDARSPAEWQPIVGDDLISRRTASSTVIGTARAMHTLSGVTTRNGTSLLVLFGGFSKCLSAVLDVSTLVMDPACNRGYYAANFTSDRCLACDNTSYSSYAGRPFCDQCPSETKTAAVGSTAISACSLCLSDSFCNNRGVCEVKKARGVYTPTCTSCNDFGYVPSDECKSPIYAFIIVGSILGVLAVLAIVLVAINVRRIVQARHENERLLRNSRREISEMTDAWKIDSTEIVLKSRIDLDCPGGFGEVWLADYRDMKVAVKTISAGQLMLNPTALEDMKQEMLLMRTLRHPNIVLFLGGGELPSNQGAFIVMEYMSRGTLTDTLRDQRVHIDREQALRFAMDIAKGMRFIHSLTPPRLHRDLKSANCLVSEKWIVKISDFGASKLLKAADMNRDAVLSFRKGSSRDDEDESFVELLPDGQSDRHFTLQSPLLGTKQWDMTTQIGTLLWRAPEMWRNEPYGTPSDVYSFGVVMWEIFTRAQPYEDRSFRNKFEIEALVLAGTRPTIRNDFPDLYRVLMESCWHDQPDERPPFDDIVRSLEKQLETARIPTMSVEIDRSDASHRKIVRKRVLM